MGWVSSGRRVHFTGGAKAMLIGWCGEPLRKQQASEFCDKNVNPFDQNDDLCHFSTFCRL